MRRVPVHVHPTDQLIDSAWRIANATRCTYYDALYLALAVRADAVLVTADGRLHRNISQGELADRIAWVGDMG